MEVRILWVSVLTPIISTILSLQRFSFLWTPLNVISGLPVGVILWDKGIIQWGKTEEGMAKLKNKLIRLTL